MVTHYESILSIQRPTSGATAHPKKIDTSTTHLHLPRILCLHGGGTNATIFRMQCRVLEKRLAPSFRLVYAQAPFISPRPGPDVTSVYKGLGPFRVWLRDEHMPGLWTSQHVASQIDDSLARAMAADDAAGATGEWVGILGFSQGAKIAASILYRQQQQQQQQQRGGSTSFIFAALVAGRGPLVWLLPEEPRPQGLVDAAAPFTYDPPPWFALGSDEHLLRLPTIHVHGLSDPGLDRHRELLHEYCDVGSATLVEWEGGHRMPIKTRDVEVVVQQIFRAAKEVGVPPRRLGRGGLASGNVTFTRKNFSMQRISV